MSGRRPDPRRQRRLEQPQAAASSTPTTSSWRAADLPAPRGTVDRPALAPGARATLGALDAVGHRVVHGGTPLPRAGAPRRRGRARPPRADRPGAAAPAQVARRPGGGHGALPRRARRRVLRHRVPRDDAGRGHDLRPAARVARALGPAALRLPRPVARLRHATRGGAARTARRRPSASSPATSAPARRWPPSPAAARSTRRWASRRSRAWSWRPARGASTRASCCGCRSTWACRRQELAATLEHRSGLLGLAGTADMRRRGRRRRGGRRRSRALALDVYVHRLRAAIAAMTAAMGGLDVLVFTGGVGEHAPPSVRRRATTSPSWASARSGGEPARIRAGVAGPGDRGRGRPGPRVRHRGPRGPPDGSRGATGPGRHEVTCGPPGGDRRP